MILGCPKEVKVQEYRVGLTPANVQSYVEAGHTVYIEHGAGAEIGFPDEAYQAAGATLTDKATLFAKSDMIIKVKEPIEWTLSQILCKHPFQLNGDRLSDHQNQS
ncbi:hypothetical protein Q7Y31_06840, partial [Glaesserella parasuis]|nr:hypothetical protein [Glaesserella parasuis]